MKYKLADFKHSDFIGELPAGVADVFICGDTGRGKTCLAMALADSWGIQPVFVQASKIAGLDDDTVSYCRLLVLDDLGSQSDFDSLRSRIVSVLSEREINHMPTIVTSNLSLTDIGDRLDSRIASRLQGFRVIKCVGGDRRVSRGGEIEKPERPSGPRMIWRPVYCPTCEGKSVRNWYMTKIPFEGTREQYKDIQCQRAPLQCLDCEKAGNMARGIA